MFHANKQIEQTEVMIPTPDGQMAAFLYTPAEPDRYRSLAKGAAPERSNLKVNWEIVAFIVV